MNCIFTCVCTVTKHWQDQDNYSTTKDTVEVLESDTLEDLYSTCASRRAHDEEGTPERYGEYTTVSFSSIREITVHNELEFEDESLKATERWKKHQRVLDAAAERKRQHERDKQQRLEAQERAQLSALQKKYGDKA